MRVATTYDSADRPEPHGGRLVLDRDAIAEREARRRAQIAIEEARDEYADSFGASGRRDCAICLLGFDGPEIAHRHFGRFDVCLTVDGRITLGGIEISRSDADALASWLFEVAAMSYDLAESATVPDGGLS
ncbi:hypothetical protein C5E51_29785 [Nocardia nova]|uniref:hypothetical protein n=1 Tax=Nocardia nova TaxID=37330 RepID=UPI000CEA6533|nr:hypothetical protein [Nocardia nova]PPJ02587.1 hypothetical protein C5E51_29785 [Nocardia nova]